MGFEALNLWSVWLGWSEVVFFPLFFSSAAVSLFVLICADFLAACVRVMLFMQIIQRRSKIRSIKACRGSKRKTKPRGNVNKAWQERRILLGTQNLGSKAWEFLSKKNMAKTNDPIPCLKVRIFAHFSSCTCVITMSSQLNLVPVA